MLMGCIHREKCNIKFPTEMINFFNVLIERSKLQLLGCQ